jgi:hypothetical protein
MSEPDQASVALTLQERHVMAHSTGWDSGKRSRLYRNHFCASEGHDDWATLQGLCARGLMRVGRKPGPLSGGDTVFVVTESGIELLKAYSP